VPRLFLFAAAVLAVSGVALAQTPDPANPALQRAYDALRIKNYDQAIRSFEDAITLAPERASIHADLAYTLLKIGESEAARDQFAESMRLDPGDQHVALEYAFLCYDTGLPIQARRTFDRLRKEGNATAADAFENVDRPLREGIARWTEALSRSPGNFSAHEELGRLAEQRDDLPLAAEHYEKAWRLRPERRSLLLDLGRIWTAQGRVEEAGAALLAASRGAEPRIAEQAHELLPARYPFVYEFRRALELDPQNVELRRELAYLQLQMGNQPDAEAQFQTVVEREPDDLLSAAQLGFLRLNRGDTAGAMPLLQKVLEGKDDDLADRVRRALRLPQSLERRPEEPRATVSSEAKLLAQRSLDKGYLQDALKYLHIAHENDPVDFDVMLKLGWLYNNLKDDQDAVKWFNLARRSPDSSISAEASRAYHNLEPSLERFRTTVWAFPMFSTRWHDLFAYAQIKTELRLPHWFIRPYGSVRFVGDTHGGIEVTGSIAPQYLSERSVILAIGVATVPWHGATGWFEAGESMRYRPTVSDPGRLVPDYRGGVAYAKGFGNLIGRGTRGFFAETNDDGIFVSRFSNDTLLYSQNRTGYTFRQAESAAAFHPQLYWNFNATVDALGQYWANYVETGPGIRFAFHALTPSLLFSVNLLRGAYLVNAGNPRGPNFNDLRVGVWYAFTH